MCADLYDGPRWDNLVDLLPVTAVPPQTLDERVMFVVAPAASGGGSVGTARAPMAGAAATGSVARSTD